MQKLRSTKTVAVRNGANPLRDLIDDEVYDVLASHSLLSDRAVRDYQLRQRFKELRGRGVPACDAIASLRKRHPYLQYDTLRKIVYKPQRKRR